MNQRAITPELHRHTALLTAGWHRRSSSYLNPNSAPCSSIEPHGPYRVRFGPPTLTARAPRRCRPALRLPPRHVLPAGRVSLANRSGGVAERVPKTNQPALVSSDTSPLADHCTDFVPIIDQTGVLRYSSALENQ